MSLNFKNIIGNKFIMKKKLEDFRDEKFIEFCQKELKEYVENYRGIESTLLATPDGFEITGYSSTKKQSGDKLAAVGSSLFALGSSLVNEFELKNCNSIILESDKGKVYIMSISDMNNSLILLVQTTEQATLGNIIHGGKYLKDAISQQLSKI